MWAVLQGRGSGLCLGPVTVGWWWETVALSPNAWQRTCAVSAKNIIGIAIYYVSFG